MVGRRLAGPAEGWERAWSRKSKSQAHDTPYGCTDGVWQYGTHRRQLLHDEAVLDAGAPHGQAWGESEGQRDSSSEEAPPRAGEPGRTEGEVAQAGAW